MEENTKRKKTSHARSCTLRIWPASLCHSPEPNACPCRLCSRTPARSSTAPRTTQTGTGTVRQNKTEKGQEAFALLAGPSPLKPLQLFGLCTVLVGMCLAGLRNRKRHCVSTVTKARGLSLLRGKLRDLNLQHATRPRRSLDGWQTPPVILLSCLGCCSAKMSQGPPILMTGHIFCLLGRSFSLCCIRIKKQEPRSQIPGFSRTKGVRSL